MSSRTNRDLAAERPASLSRGKLSPAILKHKHKGHFKFEPPRTALPYCVSTASGDGFSRHNC